MKLTEHRCQCAECLRAFSRTSGFQRHRTGEYGSGRRCMTEDEMLACGMTQNGGIWYRPSREWVNAHKPDETAKA